MNKKDPKDTHIYWANARLTMSESHAFDVLVESLETTRSEFLRKVIREAAGAGPEPLKNEMKTFREGVYQLAAIGRNFNQLVRALNRGERLDARHFGPTLNEIQDAILALGNEWKTMIRRSREHWMPDERKAST